MKLKGVNPLEQHIEKIVLGIVLVLFLVVLSMQFVTRPNDIDVGNRKVSPDQVYTVLEGQAKQLDSQLTDLSPGLPELASVDLVAQYNSAFEDSSGGAIRLSAALGQGVDVTAFGPTIIHVPGPSDGPIAALAVPMTSRPIAASQWATLDPYAVLAVPEFGAFVPAAQPFDFASVTVEATFNGKELESVLLGKSGGTAIPRRFWSASGLAILGFEAQRQRLMGDGSWGVSESIETPPHTPTPTNAMGEEAGLLELTALVATANKVADDVARPMFPPTIAGPIWTPPSERVSSADDSDTLKVDRLKKQLDRAKAELEKMVGGPGGNQPNVRPGSGKQSTRSNPRSNPRTTKTNPKLKERLEKKIKDLEEQLKDLGVDLDDAPSTSRARSSGSDIKSVLEEESVDLWLHDLGVEPGVTYRYRTRVVVNNPLFRKSSELDPDDADQQALTKDPFASGDWSDWSEQVVVGAQEYFFVTSAEASGGIAGSGAKATIELYKMFYGHYRRSTLSVSPGDALATTVRMSGDLLHFDSGVIDVQDAAKAVEALAGDDSGDLPDGISELSSRMTIHLGAYLLDVYTGQGSMQSSLGQQLTPMQVVLRDMDGDVIVRSDLGDEASSAYALASESASEASKTELRVPGMPAISPAAELFEPKEP